MQQFGKNNQTEGSERYAAEAVNRIRKAVRQNEKETLSFRVPKSLKRKSKMEGKVVQMVVSANPTIVTTSITTSNYKRELGSPIKSKQNGHACDHFSALL